MRTPFDGPLVTEAWILDRAPGDLVLVDVRWEPDGDVQEAFERGHLPDAVLMDVDEDLAAPPGEGPGRHPLPSPEAFARTMTRAGIGADTAVVAYDPERGSLAARLWWMLDVLGHPVSLLDGGMTAWSGSLETGPGREPTPRFFTSRAWPPDRIVDARAVRAAVSQGSSVLVDARSGERYRGETEPIYDVAGHIPGARNLPWADVHDPTSGRFLGSDALRERFRVVGVSDGRQMIAQCGSGVTACTDLLALRVAGMADARLYVGSWSDWIADPERPVVTGEDPGSPS